MGFRNREIEKKFIVKNKTYGQAAEYLESIFDFDRKIVNASKDYYWHALPNTKVSFVRLRYMPNGTGQMTTKYMDKDTNLNRVEIDVEIDDPDQGKRFMNQVFGDPCGSIYKKYHVLILGDEHTTVSIYSVRGDAGRVFVELEAKSLAALEKIEAKVGADLELVYEPRSLYQIFFEKDKA